MKSLIKRLTLGLIRLLPNRVASRLMSLLQTHPEIPDAWGVHIRSIHYYEPLPDFRTITEDAIRRRRDFPAVDFNLPAQKTLVRRLGAAYRLELDLLATRPEPEGFNFRNDYFTGIDAAVYYALIRDLKPARVIEIGSGNSTRMADKALRQNRAEGRGGELTCVEPYPQPRLTGANLEIQLVQQRVELVDLRLFAALQSNDILFIDSSHAVKFGGDVCHEFLEILPRLQAGVWIHVHDIFFPHDYPAEWLIEKRLAWNEQYLLEAFLSFNNAFSVQVANYWLALDHPSAVETLCPREWWPDGPHGRGSFWMQRKA